MPNAQITMKDLYEKLPNLSKNDVILDVRSPEEYKEAHIPKSLNIPVTVMAERAQELKHYEHVYIHCMFGSRAKIAFQILKEAGLNNLVCIHDAGMDAWIKSGYPVAKD